MTSPMSLENDKCPIHYENTLEQFCSTCNKCACEECDSFIKCSNDNHIVKPMTIAIGEINKEVNKFIQIAKQIEQKLNEQFYSLFDYSANFKSHVKLCQNLIQQQTKITLEKIEEKSKKLVSNLEKICQQYEAAMECEIKQLASKQTQVKTLKTLVTKTMNKPKENENLLSYWKSMTKVQIEVFKTDQSFLKGHLTPTFIPKQLDIDREGIGKVTCEDNRYIIDDEDKKITVTREQPFKIQLKRLMESDAYPLAAMIKSPSGVESVAVVDKDNWYKYNIKGRCNKEGDWQMTITAGNSQIWGSPVNIRVEPTGLVHTIDNIEDHMFYDDEDLNVTDVICKDGCILVSCNNELLKYDQSGRYINGMMQNDVYFTRMHKMRNGNMIFSDLENGCVKIYDDKFNTVQTFENEILKEPLGLAVNEENRILYVADSKSHCVIKFSINDGKLLGKIGSEGSGEGELNCPVDVIINHDGHVIVADCLGIQMYDANDKFIKTLVDHSGKDSDEDNHEENDESDNDVSYNDASDNDSSDNDASDNDESDNDASDNDESDNDESDNDESDNDENDNDESDNDESDNDESDNNKTDYKDCQKPLSLNIDMDGNIIVAYTHSLQLFNESGEFMARIDKEDDEVDFPLGVTVISQRPRRLAIANNGKNNVKIFGF